MLSHYFYNMQSRFIYCASGGEHHSSLVRGSLTNSALRNFSQKAIALLPYTAVYKITGCDSHVYVGHCVHSYITSFCKFLGISNFREIIVTGWNFFLEINCSIVHDLTHQGLPHQCCLLIGQDL